MRHLKLWAFLALNLLMKAAPRLNKICQSIMTPLWVAILFGGTVSYLGSGLAPNSPNAITSNFLIEYANSHWFLVDWLINIVTSNPPVRTPNLFYVLILTIAAAVLVPSLLLYRYINKLLNYYKISQNLNKKINYTIDDLKDELEITKEAKALSLGVKKVPLENKKNKNKKVMKI